MSTRAQISVLVVEPDPFDLLHLTDICERSGFSVVAAENGRAALNAIARGRPGVILLAKQIKSPSTEEVIQILQNDPNLRTIPIVVATSETAAEHLAGGAIAKVDKPYRVVEVERTLKDVTRSRVPENSNASLPPDTRLDLAIEYEFTRAVRYEHSVSCLVIRREQKEFAEDYIETLRQCVRRVDHVFQTADDEYAILLPETDASGAKVVAERISEFSSQRPSLPAIKLGAATFPKESVDGAEAIYRSAKKRAE